MHIKTDMRNAHTHTKTATPTTTTHIFVQRNEWSCARISYRPNQSENNRYKSQLIKSTDSFHNHWKRLSASETQNPNTRNRRHETCFYSVNIRNYHTQNAKPIDKWCSPEWNDRWRRASENVCEWKKKKTTTTTEKYFLYNSMSNRISGGVLAIFSAGIKETHTHESMKS